jgi:hypothetical protein
MNDEPGTETGPEYPMPIEMGKVREFAKATFAYGKAEAGHGSVVPPTFLNIADFQWAPRKSNPIHRLGFDINRQLHGEIEYVFHGSPPAVGDELTAQTRVERTYEKAGKRGGTMRFAVLVTEFRAPDGRLVAEERSTVLETPAPEGER